MLQVIVAGAAGRMGAMIMRAIMETDGMEPAGAFERSDHPDIGRDAGLVAGLGELGFPLAGSLEEIIENGEVVIDFTMPRATMANAEIAAAHGRAMVIGTTGLDDAQKARLKELGVNMRLVVAPNMSVGVNLLFKIVGEVARILGPAYDLEIVESHHRLKKDAPSGTAVRLAEVLADATGRDIAKCGVYGREGIIGERKPDEIAVMALRAGDIVGDHTVMYGGIGERIEITHRAHSRETFARGAVRAAAWVADRMPGMYDMQDVLGLR